jgi:vacuolar-type H+-ATPase subunit E/Vma4
VGLDELLSVLRQEAATEERALLEEAARGAERIVAEARTAAAALLEAGLDRERRAHAGRLRALREAAGRERERAALAESRRQLELLRAEAIRRLTEEVEDADVERFVTELVLEAGPVEAVLVVDPGSAPAARRALAALNPEPAPTIREAEARRGGVELVTGSLVLDDTVRSRLERSWARLEPAVAQLLLGEPGEGR